MQAFYDIFECHPVALYDMSIPDIETRNKNKLVFKSGQMAANFIGIAPNHFYRCLTPGKYVYHAETKKKYAARRVKVN